MSSLLASLEQSLEFSLSLQPGQSEVHKMKKKTMTMIDDDLEPLLRLSLHECASLQTLGLESKQEGCCY